MCLSPFLSERKFLTRENLNKFDHCYFFPRIWRFGSQQNKLKPFSRSLGSGTEHLFSRQLTRKLMHNQAREYIVFRLWQAPRRQPGHGTSEVGTCLVEVFQEGLGDRRPMCFAAFPRLTLRFRDSLYNRDGERYFWYSPGCPQTYVSPASCSLVLSHDLRP